MTSIPGTFDSTSSSLLDRVRARDAEAWRRLAELYGPVVYEWCRQSQLDAHDSADVAQEVFQAVAGAIDAFRRDRPTDTFRGWLWTITRNKIRDHFRRLAAGSPAEGGTDARRLLESIPDDPTTDEADPVAQATRRISRRALELIRCEFEEQTWQAFWGVVVGGRAAGDVAADLGMSQGAVRQAKYRVLQRLRREMAGLLE